MQLRERQTAAKRPYREGAAGGPIRDAAPAAVLPEYLCPAFARSEECPLIENDYRNGGSQRSVENPRAVQGAALKATRSNAGRRQMATLQMSPGLITA